MKRQKKIVVKGTKWVDVDIMYALNSGMVLWSFARVPLSKSHFNIVGKKVKGRLEYYEVKK